MKVYYFIYVALLLLHAHQAFCMERAFVEISELNACKQDVIGAPAYRGDIVGVPAEQKIISHDVLVTIFENVVREQILDCVKSIKSGIIMQAELQGVVMRLVVVAKIIAYVARIREQELVAIVQRSLPLCCQCMPVELLEPCICAESRLQVVIVPLAEVIGRSLYEKTFPTHTIHAAIESALSVIKTILLKKQQPFIESREKFLAAIHTIKEIMSSKRQRSEKESLSTKELAEVQQQMTSIVLQESNFSYMQQLVDEKTENFLGQLEGEIRVVVEQCVRIIFACCENDESIAGATVK